MMMSSSSQQRVVACAMLLFLQTAHGFYAATPPTNHPSIRSSSSSSSSSPSQLSMAWTLPNQDSFKPTWTYQEVGNPTARRVVYDDSEFDNHYYDDDDEFYVATFGSDWSAAATYDVSDDPSSLGEAEEGFLSRGSRIGRAARRAFQGLRNTLRP